ncbi:GcrA family cell cycle regulator [Acetobacter sp. AN02]|uniref:GcrA family cell cycle regulator n=1 Tax=Acetobacter sp. AN02 TaxID=2894186 RepID=UPI0024342F0F|nr:GcrA family cell cycle regulator [Acetobacter sp. AN02]MDG6095623.1 GcrA family cell cycle regulator [Acetobacter sp. AN02]
MEWTDETIARLRELWDQGLSTAEIGRTLGFTKNAVVGKAHRLSLPARPSPIRQKKAAGPSEKTAAPAETKAPRKEAAPPAEAPVATATPSDTPPAAPVEPVVAAPAAPAEPPAPPAVSAEVKADAPAVAVAPEAKARRDVPPEPRPAPRPAATPRQVTPKTPTRNAVAEPEPRRRNTGCCWPIGDPGNPDFHFCGATPIPGKPYCVEHAQIAYVKLRDRRDG